MSNYTDHILCLSAYCNPNQDVFAIFKNHSLNGLLQGWVFGPSPIQGDHRYSFMKGGVTIVVTKSSSAANIAYSSNVHPYDNVQDHSSANNSVHELAAVLRSAGSLECSVYKPYIEK